MSAPAIPSALVDELTRIVNSRDGKRITRGEIRFRCPHPENHKHGDAKPSARWNPELAVWHCDVCGDGGGAYDLAKQLDIDLSRYPGRWPVLDLDKRHVATHVRYDNPDGSKRFVWESPDGVSGLDGHPTADLSLYGIDRLNGRASVALVEGEQATDVLHALNIPVVGTVTGAASTPGDDALRPLLDRKRVVLWPDNDDAGREHMARVAARLLDLGHKDIRLVTWEDAPPKGDAVDFIAREDDPREAVYALLRAATPSRPLAAPSVAVNLVTMDTVEPQPVRWAWQDRIPYDGLTLVDGDPGLGKTGVLLDTAARVSTGRPMPDGAPCDGPSDVVILTVEDVLATTIRPRLEAAEADLSRIHAITGVPDGDDERPIVLPGDWPAIVAAVEATGARFVFLDPLMALLGGDVNSYRDQDVRRALVPGTRAAERLGFALVVTRHLNKSNSTNALYRGGGSIGLIGAARSAMLAATDPDDASGARRILAMTKHNLAMQAPALAYTIESATIASGIDTSRIAWHGVTQHQAGDLLAMREDDNGQRTALDEAIELLRIELADGPVPAGDIRRAWRVAGMSDATVRRAKDALGIQSRPIGNPKHGGYWAWVLPDSLDAHDPTNSHEHLEHEHLENADSDGQNKPAYALDAHSPEYEHLELPQPDSATSRLRLWLDAGALDELPASLIGREGRSVATVTRNYLKMFGQSTGSPNAAALAQGELDALVSQIAPHVNGTSARALPTDPIGSCAWCGKPVDVGQRICAACARGEDVA